MNMLISDKLEVMMFAYPPTHTVYDCKFEIQNAGGTSFMLKRDERSILARINRYPWLRFQELTVKSAQKMPRRRQISNPRFHFAKEMYFYILGPLIVIPPSQIAWLFFAVLSP